MFPPDSREPEQTVLQHPSSLSVHQSASPALASTQSRFDESLVFVSSSSSSSSSLKNNLIIFIIRWNKQEENESKKLNNNNNNNRVKKRENQLVSVVKTKGLRGCWDCRGNPLVSRGEREPHDIITSHTSSEPVKSLVDESVILNLPSNI
ncbi:unnamed protein product [Pleuronectes platessa]|uniref:Uncharacterized protein n=1 Tax=Pleuronectes platessa TaxID=8262 RepID=A0A9N7YH88_PLEPL|nr:unnamed protein product [Pleuronectes platessa]